MKLKTRILIGFLLLYIAGSYLVIDFVVNDIRPRYLETVEESLNDTVHILAALVESDVENGRLNFSSLKDIFETVSRKKIASQIYGLKKTNINLSVYVTDHRGIVLYDSNNVNNNGKDFSRWNDVHRTLRGKYGARSSRTIESDPSTNSLYVSAPVTHAGKIIGVITVVKPEDSVSLFMLLAKRKIIMIGLLTGAAFILLSILLTYWINHPIAELLRYVKSLRTDSRAVLPKLQAPEIQELAKAFDELRRELEGKEYIERYIQSLTHELKSPLSSIRGAAELLDDVMPEEQRRKFHRNITQETKRIDTIIERLLQLASLEKRKYLETIEVVNIREVTDEIIESLSSHIAHGKIHVENNINGLHAARGEKFLITHAILNLVKNAVQFTPDGGSIVFSSASDEHFTTISISDSGTGIPAFARDKVFDRFYSLPGKNQHRGNGLGLPFVKEVAHLHGGHVELTNNAGTGATATLVLANKV